MLTRNFYSWALTIATNKSIPNGYINYKGDSMNTNPATTTYPFETIYNLTKSIADTTYGVHLGSGATPPSGEDYNLEAPITSGFDVVKPSAGSVSYEGSCVTWSATYAITNTGTAPMTIAEIGTFGRGYNTEGKSVRTLFDRTVLEAPIVIEPAQCKQITYTIRINYPE